MSKFYSLANRHQNEMADPFFSDFFDFPFKEDRRNELLRTDVTEDKDNYHLSIEVPDVLKENIKISLNEGYLTINAVRKSEPENEKSDKKYLCRERFYGSYSRSFYVGNNIKQSDIHAKLTNGILHLDLAKHIDDDKTEKENYIEIES